MARTKQTSRKPTGGKAPKMQVTYAKRIMTCPREFTGGKAPSPKMPKMPKMPFSSKPMEETDMKSDQVESVKQMDLPAQATPPPVPERKESSLNMTEKENAPTLKEMME